MSESSSDISLDRAGEANIVSFVVRMWKEESTSEEHLAMWRGHITFVPTGDRQYFASINEMTGLIKGHLKSE